MLVRLTVGHPLFRLILTLARAQIRILWGLWRTIGEKLGVYYLLEGSVRKSADRVRIAVALIKAGDGANVWSETFDRELKDIFAVQSEIAGAVAKQLRVDAALKKLIDENADDAGSQIATVYALRKEPEKMFEWLEHAWTTHDGGVTTLLYDPFLSAYKDDPRFIAFAQKIGVMPKAAAHP
jgi:hypothetical protein